MKHILNILFLVIGGLSIAQDTHLSQFYRSSHLLNPAEVGNFEGDYRFTGNYRNQWQEISHPISSYLISFDRAFRYYSHEYDLGVLAIRDEFVGFGNVTTKLLFTGAYGRKIKGNRIYAGFQAGLVFNSMDLDNQTFDSQWNYSQGIFDQSWSTLENFGPNQQYLDINIGLSWKKSFGLFDCTAGFALNHVNRPKDTYFTSPLERLKTRKVLHAEVNYPLNNRLDLIPRLLLMWTTKTSDMVLGGNLEYATNLKKLSIIEAGLHYRHGPFRNLDAIIPSMSVTYNQLQLGLSYDINLSQLSDGISRKSAFELSLVFTGKSSKTEYMSIPCERF